MTPQQLQQLKELQKEWSQYKTLDEKFWSCTNIITGRSFRELLNKTNKWMNEVGFE